jgi:hypothetical protein
LGKFKRRGYNKNYNFVKALWSLNLKTRSMNLQAQKDALMKEQEQFEIPEAQRKLVMERFDKVRKQPERLLDWDEAKKKLKSDGGTKKDLTHASPICIAH